MCIDKFAAFACYSATGRQRLSGFQCFGGNLMAPFIELDGQEIEELVAVANNSAKLAEIVSKGTAIGPKVGVVLARRLCKTVGLDFDDTVLVVRGLVRTYLTRSQLEATSQAAVEV